MGQVRRLLQMLNQELLHTRAIEGTFPCEQFKVDTRQTVLIAISRDESVEGFWRSVDRRDAARHGCNEAIKVFHLPEVCDLDVIVEQEQVLRFDVEMLQLKPIVHQVENLRGLGHVVEQFFTRDARQPLVAALTETIPQIAIGQLHDDHGADHQ